MSKGTEVAKAFYEAFKRVDSQTMNGLYAEGATFSDPGFPGLDARETKGMWEMLTASAKDFRLTFQIVEASDTHAVVQWVAQYTFSRTGRPVQNNVTTRMDIKDGRIVAQIDTFDFYVWAKQAFGLVGVLIGWTPFFKNKVQATARQGLLAHLAKSRPN